MSKNTFEWHDRKAKSNEIKHGVTFEQAKEVFNDKNKVTTRSDRDGEERYQTIGKYVSKLFSVAWCKRPPNKRLISARLASSKEKIKYNKVNKSK